MQPKPKKKRVGVWITLIVAPILLLIFVALSQVVVRFVFEGSGVGGTCGELSTSSSLVSGSEAVLCEDGATTDDTIKLVINIASLLIGMLSILLILGMPIWIIFLVQAINYNSKLKTIQTPSAAQAQPDHDQTQPPQPPAYPQL